ncbi:MAG: UbiH/UbiF/VisC/COQ6 family ubiquinone biosynthesis hydroxylase, partial [Pseudomonadota bacterium]
MTEETVDVAIVGAGMAGLTCGLALTQLGLSCRLIDRVDPKTTLDDAFDGRVTAIAFAAARIFRKLGVWETLAPHAQPIRDILVTDGAPRNRFDRGGASSQFLHFDSAELGDAHDGPLGWIIENRHIRAALCEGADKAPELSIHAPAEIAETDTRAGDVALRFADGARLTASLLIAADGRGSRTRDAAGLRTVRWRYPQSGLVASVSHEQPHDGVAQEFFLPGGPFAILPMTGERSSLVWTEPHARAEALAKAPAPVFESELRDRFGPYLGDLEASGPRWTYPLAFHLTTRLTAPRLALVGDAAHGIHPIAGQGFNLGLKDIAALAHVIGDTLHAGEDIGGPSALERYQSWRRFDTALMGLGTDVINRLFSNDLPPVRAVRRAGLGLVNAIGPARRFFMRNAGGAVGDLPALMRP